MAKAAPFDSLLTRLVEHSHNAALLWQGAALVACLLLGWLAMHALRRALDKPNSPYASLREPLLRLGFPLVVLGLVALARAGIRFVVGEVHLLDVVFPLLWAWILIRLVTLALRYVFKPSPALKSWERLAGTLIGIVIAFHITGLLPLARHALEAVSFDVGQSRFSLWLLLQAALVIVLAIIVALWLAQFLESRLMRLEQMNLSTRLALVKATRTVLLIIAVLMALPALGIDLTVLSVFGGALGVGVGLGLQKIASNYISGFIILLDRSIRIGDLVTVDNKYGQVAGINTRYTLLRSLDGTESIVPNELFINQTVVNHSFTQPSVRIAVPVQVSYDADLERVREFLMKIALGHPRVIQGDEGKQARVYLTAFADSGINLELGVWVRDPSEGQQNLKSDLNWEIWRVFKENGIEIPYPQRVVRLQQAQDA